MPLCYIIVNIVQKHNYQWHIRSNECPDEEKLTIQYSSLGNVHTSVCVFGYRMNAYLRNNISRNNQNSPNNNRPKLIPYRTIGLSNWYWRILARVDCKNVRACECILNPTSANIHQYQFNNSFITCI